MTAEGQVYAWGNNSSRQIGCPLGAKEREEVGRNRSSEAEQTNGDSKNQEAVYIPTQVILDETQPNLRAIDIAAGDRFVVARIDKADSQQTDQYYAWGHGYLVHDPSHSPEQVTREPVVLGGGVELVSRFLIEPEQDDHLDVSESSASGSKKDLIEF